MAVVQGQLTAGLALPSQSRLTAQTIVQQGTSTTLGTNTIVSSKQNKSLGYQLVSVPISFGATARTTGGQQEATSKVTGTQIATTGQFQDYLSIFARFFGINTKQTTTHVYINKADLPDLNPKANNTAESLLVALLLREMQYESNFLISRIVIEKYKAEFASLSGKPVIVNTLLIRLYLLLNFINYESQNADSPITPNNI